MPQPYQRIFLLSHMRAYTSLLGHILGSHPAINGYYEMQMAYASEQALTQQEQFYARQDSFKPGSRYLFDKLLHNKHTLNLQLPGLENAILILALRQPEQTLKSIINLFAQKDTDHPYSYPEKATRYYLERLENLATFSQRHPQRYYYFDAELIRSDTESTLKKLEKWLQLDSPLTPHYHRFSKTGVAGAGDTSAAIGSGTIINQETQYPNIQLETGPLQQAIHNYWECRAQLMRNALETM
ncbi:sulfotransferase [Candidatus Thiothrix sp. Deng01]|uniref:Sulfotransferase n=1 Tax=Candidatus Thiothrix phosphatis TaxID=3112415 RepID=A0ABU6CZC0_9GAMM|nr:sulfotransferase [Candidatus Thiothrix sp. Deng01]MEB4591743.1 sulfotransferase [Candidatus Thiothrix sp. Deng01]